MAATIDGDYTCGVLMSRTSDDSYYVEDVCRGRGTPSQRDAVIVRTARSDGPEVKILLEQEPGSAGKSVTEYVTKKDRNELELLQSPIRTGLPSGALFALARESFRGGFVSGRGLMTMLRRGESVGDVPEALVGPQITRGHVLVLNPRGDHGSRGGRPAARRRAERRSI
jgi:hypothetical protein